MTVGTVDQAGKFVAKKIGTSTIKAINGNDSFEAQVTVSPYSTICKEPYWNFTDNMAATKAKESRNLVGQTATILTYSGENTKIRNVMYEYDGSGKMSSAIILFQNETAVVEESAKFFKERYSYLGEESNVYLYTDSKNIVIGITVDANLGFVAIYIPYAKANAGTNSINTKAVLSIIKNAPKIQ